MQSNEIKQIMFCIFLVIIFGVIVFIFKGYYFDKNNQSFSDNEIKDRYEYNEYKIENVTVERLVQRYFIDYKHQILMSLEDAYELLDSDSKNKYNDYFSFKETINDNIDEIRSATINKYTVQTGDSINKYTIVDQYNNKYTFTAKAVLVYKVNLEFANEIPSIFE